MIDFDKLNSLLNFNSLNTKKLTQLLLEHQNTIIKLVLIVGTLFFAGGMYNDYHAKDQALRTGKSQLQQKLEVIKTRNATIEDLNNFKSSLPRKLNEFELTRLISSYAKSYHINIPSLSPGDNQDMGSYDVINVNFNAATDSFKNMMIFLRKIEKSDYPLRIDSWSGQEGDNGEITFTISMSAVFIHK